MISCSTGERKLATGLLAVFGATVMTGAPLLERVLSDCGFFSFFGAALLCASPESGKAKASRHRATGKGSIREMNLFTVVRLLRNSERRRHVGKSRWERARRFRAQHSQKRDGKVS